MAFSLFSCQQEDVSDDDEIEYSEDIYDLKEYLVERHPPVVRNGFGMDMYHEGDSGLDTVYFSTNLPAYHPNNCLSTGTGNKEFTARLEFEPRRHRCRVFILTIC